MVTMTVAERADFAHEVRAALADEGEVCVVYTPGDMTRYELVVKCGADMPVVRSHPDPRLGVHGDEHLVVDVTNGRAAVVNFTHGWIDPSYLLGTLTENVHTSIVVAELLNMIGAVDDAMLDEWRQLVAENPATAHVLAETERTPR